MTKRNWPAIYERIERTRKKAFAPVKKRYNTGIYFTPRNEVAFPQGVANSYPLSYRRKISFCGRTDSKMEYAGFLWQRGSASRKKNSVFSLFCPVTMQNHILPLEKINLILYKLLERSMEYRIIVYRRIILWVLHTTRFWMLLQIWMLDERTRMSVVMFAVRIAREVASSLISFILYALFSKEFIF